MTPAQETAKDVEPRPVRRQIATALCEFGLLYGINKYTCVAHVQWLSNLLAVGWECEPLGEPRQVGEEMIGAMSISADSPFNAAFGALRTAVLRIRNARDLEQMLESGNDEVAALNGSCKREDSKIPASRATPIPRNLLKTRLSGITHRSADARLWSERSQGCTRLIFSWGEGAAGYTAKA